MARKPQSTALHENLFDRCSRFSSDSLCQPSLTRPRSACRRTRPTIQQAIDAAVAGDTVLVSPGTYVENITFRGKAITVASEQGPGVTIIDGNRAGSVVTFASGENRNAVLEGFTVRNGANSFSGGGVLVQNSAPSIIGNWIVGNGACSGAGIYSYFSSPLIKGNTISRNYVYACSGASGLGVYIGGDSAAELIENVITENSGFANGGGVTLFAAGRVVLRSNVIARNVTSGFSPCTSGGGIWMVNFSQATIVNNLVVGNVAGCGGGFYWGGSTGVTTFVNNTFADNDGAEGSAIEVSGVDTRHVIYNNVIIGKAGQTALYCRNSSSTPSPLLNTSDVFAPQGLAYGGTCLDQTGLRGNISADPLFARNAFGDVLGDYRLRTASPAIDAGDNAAPQIPAADLDGTPRIADGNQDGDARVDIGAYEYTQSASRGRRGCRSNGHGRRKLPRDRGAGRRRLVGCRRRPVDVHVDRTIRDGVRRDRVRVAAGRNARDHADRAGWPRRLFVGHAARDRRRRDAAGDPVRYRDAVGVVAGKPSVRRRHHRRVRFGRVWRIRALPDHLCDEQRAGRRRRLDHHR